MRMDRLSAKSSSKSKLGKHGSEDEEFPKISVVFKRDETGYGITVCGDNPVYIQSVMENGPAYNAGLRQYDRIIKVNGTLVTRCNHQEVVQLVKSAPCCAMTVIRVPVTNDHPGVRLINEGLPAPSSGYYNNGTTSRSNSFALSDSSSLLLPSPVPIDFASNSMYLRRPSDLQFVDKPPTPPPVDSIPRPPFDDLHLPRSPASVSRRSSNPEVRHLGIMRPTLSTRSFEETSPSSASSLGRSASTVSVKRHDSLLDSSMEETPPPLPTKRVSSDARLARARTTSIHDVCEMSSLDETPPPPYLDANSVRLNGTRVPKSDSFSGVSNNQLRPALPPGTLSLNDAAFPFGPFSNFKLLKSHPPHLVVFLHHLFSQNEPSANALLFHLITEQYAKGTAKDMQRWAYELHFTFLVPGSPLEITSCQRCISSIDETLQSHESEEALREIFTHTRRLTSEAINASLGDFHRDRQICMIGPFNESYLNDALTAKDKLPHIVDQTLVKDLEFITNERPEPPENRHDVNAARGCALATFLKINNYKAIGQDGAFLLDKWPLFVQKDRTRFKWQAKTKKPINVRGHQFAPATLTPARSRSCHCCQSVLWGVSPQGYECLTCRLLVHRGCLQDVEETCIGEDRKERRSIMDSFQLFGRKRSNNSPTAISHAKKTQEEKEEAELREQENNAEQENGKGYVHQVVSRFETGKMQEVETPPDEPDKLTKPQLPSFSMVGRSESLKALKKQQSKAGARKKSDPHFYADNNHDEGVVVNGISGSSSTSLQSFSANDSPSASTDTVCIIPLDDKDSDLEVEPDRIPDWKDGIRDKTVLDSLSSRERKRQEVLAELFHTERTHVRHLKVLHRVFFVPLQNHRGLLPEETFRQVFANLEEMIRLHSEFNKQMRRMKNSGEKINNVGDLLLSRFDGENGQEFRGAAADFCRNQERGLEELKARLKKDSKLARFLEEAEANGLCRRLQLKDIIPIGMQRLTKYPLLLENLLKYTTAETEAERMEQEKVKRALLCSREILDHVNSEVRLAANQARLKELHDKIDMTPYNKSQEKLVLLNNKNLDLSGSHYKLILDGDLTWRLSKQKSVDLHVILLDRLILLVTKEDDKLRLKFHESPVVPNLSAPNRKPNEGSTSNLNQKKSGESLKYWAPVLSLDRLYIKDVATDRCAFFLFTNFTQTGGAQMYELVASSAHEKSKWSSHISEAIKNYPKIYEATPIAPAVPLLSESVVDSISVSDSLDSTVTAIESVDEPQNNYEEVEHIDEVTSQIDPQLSPLYGVNENTQTELEDDGGFDPVALLRRRAMDAEAALADKERVLLQIFGGPAKDLDVLSDDELCLLPARDLLNSVMSNVITFSRLVNEATSLPINLETCSLVPSEVNPQTKTDTSVQTRPSIPVVDASLLTPISMSLDRECTALMASFQSLEDERIRLKEELQALREQFGQQQAAGMRHVSPAASHLSIDFEGAVGEACLPESVTDDVDSELNPVQVTVTPVEEACSMIVMDEPRTPEKQAVSSDADQPPKSMPSPDEVQHL